MSDLKKAPLVNCPGYQPQGLSKNAVFPENQVAAFNMVSSVQENLDFAMEAAGLSAWDNGEALSNHFWKLRVTGIQEKHAEGDYTVNTLADTFLTYSTGAMPIQISIQGKLLTMKDQDHRLDFLNLYEKCFRGTKLQDYGIFLAFTLKDTQFYLRPTNLNVGQTSELAGWTTIQLQGVAFNYIVYSLNLEDMESTEVAKNSTRAFSDPEVSLQT